MKKVYLAGPGVFRPNAKEIGDRLKLACSRCGVEGLWPADNVVPPSVLADKHIFAANVEMIRGCDAVVADVTPFRGPHLDVGTAWEIGFAYGLGLPVFAYASGRMNIADILFGPPLIDRIWCEETPSGWRDCHGDLVEDFQLFDNLMIARSVRPLISETAAIAIMSCASELRRGVA